MRTVVFLAIVVLVVTGVYACAPQATPPPSPTSLPTKAAPVTKQAWETDWEKALTAAKQEKRVVMYTTAGPEIRKGFTDALKQKYGLEMEFVVGKGVELAQKLLTERRAGLYLGDVYMSGATSTVAMLIPEGAMDVMTPELIHPEVLDTTKWYGNKLPFLDKEQYLFGFRGSVFWPCTINTTIVKPDEVASYRDLLNTKFKGKIAMVDPTIEGAANSFVALVSEYILSRDYIRDLVKQGWLTDEDKNALRPVYASLAKG